MLLHGTRQKYRRATLKFIQTMPQQERFAKNRERSPKKLRLECYRGAFSLDKADEFIAAGNRATASALRHILCGRPQQSCFGACNRRYALLRPH